MENTTSDSTVFVITRLVDAPRELVWKVWTQAEHLQQWFGPKGFAMPIGQLDFKAGGSFLYCLRSANGYEMWAKWLFREIVKSEKIVLVQHFSNNKGAVMPPPFDDPWPTYMLLTITFAERAEKTLVTISSRAYNANEVERKTFDSNHASMQQGWRGTFEQLDRHLVQVQLENR